jgi:hypothetical protein
MVVSQIIVNTFALIVMNFLSTVIALMILDIRIPDGNEIYLALLIILTILFGQYTAFFLTALINSFSTVIHIVTGVSILVSYVCGKNLNILSKSKSILIKI